VCLAIASVLFVGCGGDDDDAGSDSGVSHGGSGGSKVGGSGGSNTGGTGGSSSGDRLESGTYDASNVEKISDGCNLTLEDGSFTSTEIINTGTQLSIGKKYDSTTSPQWDPAGYGLGSGDYTTSTTATLTVTAHATDTDDGCEWDVDRTTKVTFTGNDAVSIDYTDKESNQNSKCSADAGESTSECTSHYTFDLKKQET
jgi:hypothetical protein